MYVYRRSRGLTYRRRKRRNFSVPKQYTDYNCASRNHFKHTSESFTKCGYFCTQYMFVSQGLQGFTVGRTHDSQTIHIYVCSYIHVLCYVYNRQQTTLYIMCILLRFAPIISKSTSIRFLTFSTYMSMTKHVAVCDVCTCSTNISLLAISECLLCGLTQSANLLPIVNFEIIIIRFII